jgi:hypothetical protein
MIEMLSRNTPRVKPAVVAIDDDSFGLTILSELLNSEGYTVIPGNDANDL